MTVSLARLNEIVDACETPIRSESSAATWISQTVYRMLKSEYRTMRRTLASMHQCDARYDALLDQIRCIKLQLRSRSLEFTLTNS